MLHTVLMDSFHQQVSFDLMPCMNMWNNTGLSCDSNLWVGHCAVLHSLSHGLLSFSSVGWKAEYGLTLIFWLISLLYTTKKKFPKINLHDSELMAYVHVHGRQLTELLLHMKYIIDCWRFSVYHYTSPIRHPHLYGMFDRGNGCLP